MDGKSNKAISLLENEMTNYTRSSYSVCYTNNSSVTSNSRSSVSQSGVESSTKFATPENDYIRQEMITALAWATCRAFKYRPSDPIHYLAHQLLHWRYGDVSDKNSTAMNLCEDTCVGPLSRKDTSPSQ